MRSGNINLYIKEFLFLYKELGLGPSMTYILIKLNISFLKIFISQNKIRNRGWGILGAGNYNLSIHLPILLMNNEPLYALQTRSVKKLDRISSYLNFSASYKDSNELLKDRNCDFLLIGSANYLHTKHLEKAIESNVSIYCEKPVAINKEDINILQRIEKEKDTSKVMVGFNRRFSPSIFFLKNNYLNNGRAQQIEYVVNFGNQINKSIQDPKVGGGIINGITCHYVDLISYISESKIISLSARGTGKQIYNNFEAVLELENNSEAILVFSTEGKRPSRGKENIIIREGDNTYKILDFEELKLEEGTKQFKRNIMGTRLTWEAFFKARDNLLPMPISLNDGINAAIVTNSIQESIQRNGEVIDLAL